MSAESVAHGAQHEFRVPYETPPEGTPCAALVNKARKETCGEPATVYKTVSDRFAGPTRVALCDTHERRTNYAATRSRSRNS